MKNGIIACLSLLLAWAAVAIAQLWFEFFTTEVFVKTTMTMAIIIVVIFVITLATHEYLSEKKLKDQDFIND